MTTKVRVFFCLITLFIWGCTDESLDIVSLDLDESSIDTKSNESYNEDRNLYFGDRLKLSDAR